MLQVSELTMNKAFSRTSRKWQSSTIFEISQWSLFEQLEKWKQVVQSYTGVGWLNLYYQLHDIIYSLSQHVNTGMFIDQNVTQVVNEVDFVCILTFDLYIMLSSMEKRTLTITKQSSYWTSSPSCYSLTIHVYK